MAINPDVLVTALQEVRKGETETFTKFHPCFDKIVEKGNKTKLDAPWVEFAVVTEGVGSINDVGNDPDKFLTGGRRQSGVKGNEYGATLIYVYDVPGQDLREAHGEADLVGLLKRYPIRSMADFKETIAMQLVMGNGPGCSSVFTFNGDATYSPKGQSRKGMFEMEASASQTNTVHGLTQSTTRGWYTQHRHITAMGSDGLKKMRYAYGDAEVEGANPDGSVDLMIGDRDSFENYCDELTDFIQFVSADKGDPGPGKKTRQGVPFREAIFYPEPYIIRADFTTTDAQSGIIYGINSSKMILRTQGHDAKMETNGDFAHRGPIRLPQQDMWRYEIVESLLIHTTSLRHHFSVSGGANP